jgi:hypothetical protein
MGKRTWAFRAGARTLRYATQQELNSKEGDYRSAGYKFLPAMSRFGGPLKWSKPR